METQRGLQEKESEEAQRLAMPLEALTPARRRRNVPGRKHVPGARPPV